MAIAAPRRISNAFLFSPLPVALYLILHPLAFAAHPLPALYTSLGFAIIAAISVAWLVPRLGPAFVKVGLKGKDLMKDRDEEVPESAGLICAAVYLLLLILFIPFLFTDFFVTISPKRELEGLAAHSLEFPHQQLALYLSAILSLLIATLLGFLDDLFDIRWRHKLPIPILASIPLLMVYIAEKGSTSVVIPIPLRPFFGTIVNLGPFYYLYMSLFSNFATNSINILAGINGIEVSQALIIALSVALNDLLYLPWSFRITLQYHLPLFQQPTELSLGGVYAAGLSHGSKELLDRHLMSLYFMLPLIGVCLGFLYHNWYPARSFPGDTLCYVTGMSFAVVGILGHYSKTLGLFFLPQLFNAILSGPQLFGLVPCPRHRIPSCPNHKTGLLVPSIVVFERPPSLLATAILRVFAALRLIKLTYKGQRLHSTTNLTILNTLLVIFGPMSEQGLVLLTISVQVFGSTCAFGIRYGLAGMVYDGDRR